jgi:hypothetical protein
MRPVSARFAVLETNADRRLCLFHADRLLLRGVVACAGGCKSHNEPNDEQHHESRNGN